MNSNLEYIKTYVDNFNEYTSVLNFKGVINKLLNNEYKLGNISKEEIKKNCKEL